METYIQELAEKDNRHRSLIKLRKQKKNQTQQDQEGEENEEEEEGVMADKRKRSEEEDLEESQMVRKYSR